MTEDQLIESILLRMQSEQLVVVSTEQARRAECFDDLLAALKAIADLEDTESNEWDAVERVIPEMCNLARAAIAKAEGLT